MKKKLAAMTLGCAALGAALATGQNTANAAQYRTLTGTNTAVVWNDSPMNPWWATLQVELRHNGSSVTLNPVGLSTWGETYTAYLSWACSNGYSQATQNNLVVPAGTARNCVPPGWPYGAANNSFAAVDDL
jgi:hypothetical protein